MISRFFQFDCACFPLHRLPGSFGCVIYNRCYPTQDECDDPSDEEVMRILELIRIKARNTHTVGTDKEERVEENLPKDRRITFEMLERAYQQTLWLRSHILGVMYDMIDFGSATKRIVGEVSVSQTDSGRGGIRPTIPSCQKQCRRMFQHPYGKRLLIKVSIYDKVLLEYGEENRGAVK